MKRILNGGQMYNLILLSLSTWRMSSMIRDEAGPYSIFERFRAWAGITEAYYNGKRELYSNGTLLSDILQCFWCLSIWVGAIVALIAVVFRVISLSEFIFYTLSNSAIAILIETKLFTKEN